MNLKIHIPVSVDGQSCTGILVGESCYKIQSGIATWFDAKSRCTSQGMRLAHVTDTSKQTAIQNIIQTSGVGSVWIGGQMEYMPIPRWRWLPSESDRILKIAMNFYKQYMIS